MTATNTSFDLTIGPQKTTFSFKNEQVIILDDQASNKGNNVPHFVRIFGDNEDSSQQSLPEKSLNSSKRGSHAFTLDGTFSYPFYIEENQKGQIQIDVSMCLGFVELVMTTNTFPPFLNFIYSLLQPLEQDSLAFLEKFQEIKKRTYQFISPHLIISCKSIFEGVTISFYDQSREFINIMYILFSLSFSFARLFFFFFFFSLIFFSPSFNTK